MKKLMIMVIGFVLIALFLMSVKMSFDTKSKFMSVIREIDILTDKSVELIGNQPTVQSVNNAKGVIEEKKIGIVEKLRIFRNEGRLREKSEEYFQLEDAAGNNKNKIAKIYDDFVEKAKNDIRSLDEEKARMLKSNKKLSDGDIAILEKKSKLIEENIDVLKALDDLMTSYETIFDNKK